MFFRVTTSKDNKYLQLVESFRNEQGQSRHRVLANLSNISHLSEAQLRQLAQSFVRALGLETILSLDELEPGIAHDYGDVLPVVALWQKLDLSRIIRSCLSPKIQIDVPNVALVLTANKFVDPQSKYGAYRWYDRALFCLAQEFEHFPEPGKERLHAFYRTLDYLSKYKKKIEKELYYQLQAYGLDTELILYDITSSYFEGTEAELGRNGFSRDHRPDALQIVIGIVTSKSGIPFAHHVFMGNTCDKSTVTTVIEDLKRRFGISHCIFVGDRGMMSRINLKSIKGREYDYIMGLRKHNSRLVRELLSFIKERNTEEVIEIRQNDLKDEQLKQAYSSRTRFVIGFNATVQKEVRENRQKKLEEFEKFLCSIPLHGTLEEISNSKTKINNYLSKKRLKRFFKTTLEPTESEARFHLTVTKKTLAFEEEELLDGRFFLQTEVEIECLDETKVISAYKSLQKVENIFRVLKNTIELRPIYVRKEHRIRGHVFICFLAYLIECLLEKTLAEVLPNYTMMRLREELGTIKLVPLNLPQKRNLQPRVCYLVTHVSAEIQKFYAALKIRNYRTPERLYFIKKKPCSNNFSRQLMLFY